jgi:NAD(P)-dependent dehydrogenase (short-subunit alcohol dehydrogenase family)
MCPAVKKQSAMIHKAGGKAMFQHADVSNPADVAALVAGAVDEYGRLDCAVNNAGIEGTIAPFADQTEANYDAIMSVNAKGHLSCVCRLKSATCFSLAAAPSSISPRSPA